MNPIVDAFQTPLAHTNMLKVFICIVTIVVALFVLWIFLLASLFFCGIVSAFNQQKKEERKEAELQAKETPEQTRNRHARAEIATKCRAISKSIGNNGK